MDEIDAILTGPDPQEVGRRRADREEAFARAQGPGRTIKNFAEREARSESTATRCLASSARWGRRSTLGFSYSADPVRTPQERGVNVDGLTPKGRRGERVSSLPSRAHPACASLFLGNISGTTCLDSASTNLHLARCPLCRAGNCHLVLTGKRRRSALSLLPAPAPAIPPEELGDGALRVIEHVYRPFPGIKPLSSCPSHLWLSRLRFLYCAAVHLGRQVQTHVRRATRVPDGGSLHKSAPQVSHAGHSRHS